MSIPFQHRGIQPSTATAEALRLLIATCGDWAASRRLKHTRLTLARVAARLPVNPPVLADIEAQLAASPPATT